MTGAWQVPVTLSSTLTDVGMQMPFARVFTFVSSTDGRYIGWWYRRKAMGVGSSAVQIERLNTNRTPYAWEKAAGKVKVVHDGDCWALDKPLSDAFCVAVELDDVHTWTAFCRQVATDFILPHYRGGR